ncbi:Leucine rich repeat 4 [Gossypium australe]|uniref:Leucine rich repeat 4 n=1 Tax=Gossypium australe TaxID=47621 RepID=A0A5B6UNR1_9ROSI|nr:Leucine rich repeat 4 [Gossypium australe]
MICHKPAQTREVALVLSSEEKLYVLLVGVTFDGSESILDLLGSHRVEDIREVLVGLSLQVVRVYVKGSVAYLFVTRSIGKSSQLLYMLKAFDSSTPNDKCSLRSLEQVQAELFEKQICGGLKLSIFQYSMVLFWQGGHEGLKSSVLSNPYELLVALNMKLKMNGIEEPWFSRSLFVIGGHVLVCVEDIFQFSSLLNNACSSPYFSLDSSCNIADISEMVIEQGETCCITLAIKSSTSKAGSSTKTQKRAGMSSKKWKLKWFSQESLSQFVALVKAIHLGMTLSPLLVRYKS